MEINVLFRVDAGENHGLGHLHRCLGLACALRASNFKCIFLLHGSEEARSRVQSFGFEVFVADPSIVASEADLERTLQSVAENQCSIAIIDSYHIGPQYLAHLRSAGLFVIVIDDLALHPFPCQMVVNGAVTAELLPYVSAFGDTRFLLGTRYVLLRPEFWSAPERNYASKVKSVMLTVGGTDRVELLCRLIVMLDELESDFSIRVILGPFSKNLELIERAAANCQRPVTLENSPASLYQTMLHSDLALTAAGQTAYELAALGTPMVAFSIADNQIPGLGGFARLGVCAIAGTSEDLGFWARLKEATTELLRSASSRQRLGLLERSLVDGRGASRVAALVQRLPTYWN